MNQYALDIFYNRVWLLQCSERLGSSGRGLAPIPALAHIGQGFCYRLPAKWAPSILNIKLDQDLFDEPDVGTTQLTVSATLERRFPSEADAVVVGKISSHKPLEGAALADQISEGVSACKILGSIIVSVLDFQFQFMN